MWRKERLLNGSVFSAYGIKHILEQKIELSFSLKKNQIYAIALYRLEIEDTGDFSGYNVHLLRRMPNFDNTEIVIRQPSNDHWGVFGFSYQTKKKALTKMVQLAAEYGQKNNQNKKFWNICAKYHKFIEKEK